MCALDAALRKAMLQTATRAMMYVPRIYYATNNTSPTESSSHLWPNRDTKTRPLNQALPVRVLADTAG